MIDHDNLEEFRDPQTLEALLFYNGFQIRSCYGNWQARASDRLFSRDDLCLSEECLVLCAQSCEWSCGPQLHSQDCAFHGFNRA